MSKAIRIHAVGGPEALVLEDVDPGQPGPGEALIRHTAIGVNFIDVYFRTGLYPAPHGLPFTPGAEAAGVVETVGEGVTNVRPGDRVAYVGPPGAYSTHRVFPAERLVAIPDAVDDRTAAAIMLKGMTAEYLLRRTFPVQSGDAVLFHAAAGGVGLIAGQWAKHIGAKIIGTAGGPEKVALAAANGYDHLIDYRSADFVAEVKRLTGGALCNVVYDSVGKDTFPGSLDCLRPRGMFVSFGQSSGPIPPFNMAILSQKGSLYATRPSLFAYVATREELAASAAALFDVVASGVVKVSINQVYPLAEAARAHADLEGRQTTGASILIP